MPQFFVILGRLEVSDSFAGLAAKFNVSVPVVKRIATIKARARASAADPLKSPEVQQELEVYGRLCPGDDKLWSELMEFRNVFSGSRPALGRRSAALPEEWRDKGEFSTQKLHPEGRVYRLVKRLVDTVNRSALPEKLDQMVAQFLATAARSRISAAERKRRLEWDARRERSEREL